jgi:hypothetical protein
MWRALLGHARYKMACALKPQCFPHDPPVATEPMSDAGGRGMPKFERPSDGTGAATRQDFRWLMSSHVCKHCTHAGRLDVYPTGALFRTEFGTVVVLPGAKIRGRRRQPSQGHHISSSSAGVDGQSRSTRRTRASSGSPATLYPHKGRDVAAMRWSSDSTHSARISTNLDHRMTRCTSCSAAPPS